MWWMTEDRTGLMNPFSRMNRLQSEINRLFEGQTFASFPAINAWSDEGKVEIRAEMPGVDPKDMKISILGDQLSIEAGLKPSTDDKKAVWHRQERPCGKFAKSFTLPYAVESDSAVAKCKNGVLSLTLKRQESSKPRRIEVHS